MSTLLGFATIENHIEEIARKIVSEELAREKPSAVPEQDSEAMETRQQVQLINAKEFITIREAAFLLSCSRGHIDNLLDKARDGNTPEPIPFRDLDGLVVFHREELLAWSQKAKESRKRRRAVQVATQ
jgi:predicted DNA-binding transcriptional regulator AlpA